MRFVFSAVLVCLTILADAQTEMSFNLCAGDKDRPQMPVFVPFKSTPGASYVVADTEKNREYPAQFVNGDSLLFIYPYELKADSCVRLLIRRQDTVIEKSALEVTQSDSGLLVRNSGKPVLFYHTVTVMPPGGSPEWYKRSGFIHPLYAPGGQILTDDFPVGHTHQHGMFNAWVNTTYKGEKVDFWNQHQGTGTVEHRSVDAILEGPVATEVSLRLNQVSLKYGNILDERWKLRIYPFSDYFLFDLIIEQTNIGSDTLFLNPYHYGGMALRGSREWNSKDKAHFIGKWNINTGTGVSGVAANHTRAGWINAFGKTEKGVAGVAVFDHITNSRYPQPVRIHEEMPYWCFAPTVEGAIAIAPGRTYKVSYRYLVHQGEVSPEFLHKMDAAWNDPPSIKPDEVTARP